MDVKDPFDLVIDYFGPWIPDSIDFVAFVVPNKYKWLRLLVQFGAMLDNFDPNQRTNSPQIREIGLFLVPCLVRGDSLEAGAGLSYYQVIDRFNDFRLQVLWQAYTTNNNSRPLANFPV